MKRASKALAIVAIVAAGPVGLAHVAQSVESHVAAAKAAAGQDHVALFNRLCAPPAARPAAAATPAPATPAAPRPAGPPPASAWHVEPVKVFDNLYFVGEKEYVLIANHTDFDSSTRKLPALAARKPGEAHPYVIGANAVQRCLTVAEECAQAAVLR